jgi:hypothetical protein
MASANKHNSTVKNSPKKQNQANKTMKLNVSKFLGRGTNIKFVRTNAGWNVVGKSAYNWKDNVKALGAKWHKANTTWRLPKDAKLGPIRKILATLKRTKEAEAKKPVSISKHLEKGTDIKITREEPNWIITGKSAYDWKEEIKALGGRWQGDRRAWVLSTSKTVVPLRHLLAKLRTHKYQETYKKALAEFNPSWRCCDKMKVYSFTSGQCSIHCPEGSWTPRGCYTGD